MDDELEGPLFDMEGGRFMPRPMARGPWSPDSLHGGPPAALLGRAVERHQPHDPPMFTSRVTFEILRPVPVRPLEIHVETLRPGKRVQVVEAVLRDADQEVMRARAQRLRVADLDLDRSAVPVPSWTPPPPPQECHRRFRMEGPWVTFGQALEVRITEGQPFMELGEAACWFRLKVPLLDGEEISPLVRVLAAADFPNGISNVVPWEDWVYINPDLDVQLHRLPDDEWVHLAAATHLGRGHGTAHAAISDAEGSLGWSTQSLLVFPR